jgi:hypothetical protein
MTRLLQAKDDHWRGRRRNGAAPVFDPGLTPSGSDEEAGGARAPAALDDGTPRTPMDTSPDAGQGGLRLTPRIWYAALAAVLLTLVIAAVATVAG